MAQPPRELRPTPTSRQTDVLERARNGVSVRALSFPFRRYALDLGAVLVALTAAAAAIGVTAAPGCSPSATGPATPTPPSSHASLFPGAPPQHVARPEQRVAIITVEREGDPSGGAAMAVTHDLGPTASHALSALAVARLRAEFPDVEAIPNAGGYRIRAWVPNTSRAQRFAEAATEAALTPVEPGDPALAAVSRRIASLPSDAGARASVVTSADAVTAGLSECAGEAPLSSAARVPFATTASGAAQIEAWRADAHRRDSVAFAVVGPKATADAAIGAIEGGPEWPAESATTSATAASVSATPPAAATSVAPPTIGTAASAEPNPRRLSVGVWTPDPAAARSAAHALGRAGSPLLNRLRVLGRGAGQQQNWRLERVAASTRRGSACVRVDLTRTGSSAPTRDEVELAARTVQSEAEAALEAPAVAASASAGSADDPRRAAAVVAWNHLATPGQPAAPRIQWLQYEPQPGDPLEDIPASLRDAATPGLGAPIHMVWASERGQGDLRVLVASPCGTAMESGRDAGLGALVMGSLALEHDRGGGVAIAPWASVDGVGLVARAGAREGESAEEQARRVAAALGELLTAQELDGGSLRQGQAALEASFGPPTPGYAALLRSLAPDHSSWLDPRGDRANAAATNRHRAESIRRSWLKGPLRIAVIHSGDDEQPAIVARELERWLGPWRSGAENICPSAPTVRPDRGALRVRASADAVDAPVADAYVAVPFASPKGVLASEARFTVHAMNRPGGWLEQALMAPGLATSAQAFVLGGHQMGALVVELRADPDRIDDAIAQVRALMVRLSQGAVTPADALSAGLAMREETQRAARDPNSRLLRLWMQRPGPSQSEDPGVTLQSLKAFLAGVFRPRAHMVVIVERD